MGLSFSIFVNKNNFIIFVLFCFKINCINNIILNLSYEKNNKN